MMSRKMTSCCLWSLLSAMLCSRSAGFMSLVRMPRSVASQRFVSVQGMSESNGTTPLFAMNSTIVGTLDAPTSSSSSSPQFGEAVSLKRPVSIATPTEPETSPLSDVEAANNMRRRNAVVAALSVCLAVGNFLWDFTHPVTPVQLLATMQQQSAPVSVIGNSGKPTLVDFWAPWCENCKLSAPTLLKVEEEYKDSVNFVMVNADARDAWPLIEAFRVDAIPHMALVSADGDVETALIGPIPKHVLEQDLDTMLRNVRNQNHEDLPHKMLDVFAGSPGGRRMLFDP